MSESMSGGLRGLINYMVRYILLMIVAALAVGVVYREYSKAMLHDRNLEEIITTSYYLSLTHGHILIACVAVPGVLLLITYILGRTGYKVNYSSLRKAFTIYVIGATGAVGLLFYKGLGIIYYYTVNPSAGLTGADEALFFGSHVFRESVYGIIHLLLGIGLVWYIIVLYRSTGKTGFWED